VCNEFCDGVGGFCEGGSKGIWSWVFGTSVTFCDSTEAIFGVPTIIFIFASSFLPS
jgi:hypothetical protein